LIRPSSASWRPRALTASAVLRKGILEVWETVLEHRKLLTTSGEFEQRRRNQARAWMWKLVDEGLLQAFRQHAGVAAELPILEKRVEARETTPAAAARALLQKFRPS